MPLVKIFARVALTKSIPLAPLQQAMCGIWGTSPSTTKLMLTHVADWTEDTFQEDVYVDVRAKATPERTREVVQEGLSRVQAAFAEVGAAASDARSSLASVGVARHSMLKVKG